MKHQLVNTKNVTAYYAGLEQVKRGVRGIMGMMLLVGPEGSGKTTILQKTAMEEGYVYVRCKYVDSARSLLQGIVAELGETPAGIKAKLFQQARDQLTQYPRILLLDEADYPVDHGFIETVRDLSDVANVPVIISGMGNIDKKLMRYPHFFDRIRAIVRFGLYTAEEIKALSSRPSNLRGRQGKATIDEAAFHDDLPGLLKAAMAFLMWGGRVAVISTHEGDDNPFNELVNDIRAGKRPASLHRVTLDDALGEGLYRRICLTLKQEWSPEAEQAWRQKLIDFYNDDADEELFCVPARGKGIYFPRALVEACMSPDIPVLTWTCPARFVELPDAVRTAEALDWCEEYLAPLLEQLSKNRKTWIGGDFGRTGDLSVFLPLQESPELVYRSPFAVELSNVPFRQQEQIFFYIVDRLPRFTGGALDARGNGQYLAEVAMQRYGASRIHQVMLSTEWYRDHMPKYKTALEDQSIVLPLSADIVADHRAARMEKGVARVPEGGRTKGSDGRQRHGDSAIAGALSWYARNEIDGGDVEYESVDGRKMAVQGAY